MRLFESLSRNSMAVLIKVIGEGNLKVIGVGLNVLASVPCTSVKLSMV